MPSLLETLASYVPAMVVRRCISTPRQMTTPGVESFQAAALFADISGFTALAERLSQRGPAGAEELTRILNTYFGQLIEVIYAHGGEAEIVKFAGDAFLSLWPAHDQDLATATLRASQCGLAIQAHMQQLALTDQSSLTLKVGIGVGEIYAMRVGGQWKRWELLVAGDPLVQMGTAEHQAKPGDVVLSPEAYALMSSDCRVEPREAGCVRLQEVLHPYPVAEHTAPLTSRWAEAFSADTNPQAEPGEIEEALHSFIPGAITRRLEAGQTGWLAELRRVTVLFINLPDFNFSVSPAEAEQSDPRLATIELKLEAAQTVMRALQEALYNFEGSINKLGVDDKGVTLIAALGLPPLAHEDDAARAVLAALQMQARLRELGWHSAIGVTTGRAFCGTVGSDLRREYTMIGDVVNLSARLMQAAPNDILCDGATYQAAESQVVFETLPAINVKGKAEPVAIYRPLERAKKASRAVDSRIVGRINEREMLAAQLDALRQGGKGGVVIVEGEAGIGKSRLVDELRRLAHSRRVTVFTGSGDAVEKSTSYYAWRSVFSQLFDMEILVNPESRRRHILDLLELEPELYDLAPLLNSILILELPDNEITAQLSGQERADKTREFLLDALKASVARSPKVLILEDAHWMDSASWALVGLVSQFVHPLLLIISTRPLTEPLPPEYRTLLNSPDTFRLKLDSLPTGDTLHLICQRLGINALPEPVAKLILEKAEGNPFFTEELAYAMRDSGLLQISDGECRLAPGAGDLRSLNFPDTVQAVTTSRIDRLTPSQQLTLKTASVIGRAFAFRLLRDIYPLEADRPQLADYLTHMENLDITLLESPEPELAYLFKHVITQEVAYNLMLFSQRRLLHRAVAEWYEASYAEDLSPHYPLLAHHWGRAEEKEKALEYLVKAGEEALRDGSYREAVRFFRDALQMVADGVKAGRGQPEHWQSQLREAEAHLAQLTESYHF